MQAISHSKNKQPFKQHRPVEDGQKETSKKNFK